MWAFGVQAVPIQGSAITQGREEIFLYLRNKGPLERFFSFGRTISLTKNCGNGMPLSMESIRNDFPLGGSYGSSLEFRGESELSSVVPSDDIIYSIGLGLKLEH